MLVSPLPAVVVTPDADVVDPVLPSFGSPSYQTVREINADASAWGDVLVGGGFTLSGTIHTVRC